MDGRPNAPVTGTDREWLRVHSLWRLETVLAAESAFAASPRRVPVIARLQEALGEYEQAEPNQGKSCQSPERVKQHDPQKHAGGQVEQWQPTVYELRNKDLLGKNAHVDGNPFS
jgi:hypothetical protein